MNPPLLAKELIHTADAPLPPEEAAATMIVPEGFNVTLFAGEPDVLQPIGFCIDDRGRLWVAEAHNYPKHGNIPGDRILILEDSDSDGRFDKRTVFYDLLNYVTGVEVGFGGAWVMSPPFLYFIPDRDGDDIPDGEPEILLDGFGNHANPHNLANGFAWGPDGWLYGTHGRTNWSLVGQPGTPEEERTRFDGGVYRIHPLTREWEPFCDGATNPWGIDWNDHGEAFMSNCVDPHLFHVIQGAHYEPWRGRESSRFAYRRIETIADHLHWVDNDIRGRLGSDAVNAAGGGHAHCGMMVYLGDNWPEQYRNHAFFNNIHGRRINQDIPSRAGSGYTAAHAPDLMISKDPWYMGVTLQYGPGGAVYALDWSDTGECHSYKNTRRETGRIHRISYGENPAPRVDLAKATDRELFDYQSHRNDWYVRHARRLLQERHAAGADLGDIRKDLFSMFGDQKEIPGKLRALWALHVTGGLEEQFLLDLLDHKSEHIRAWAVRLLREDDVEDPSPALLEKFFILAGQGDSPLVRLHLASALQRIAPEKRWTIASALARRAEDIDDQNLPLMTWYAIEPLIDTDLRRFVSLASIAKIPLIRRHIARRAVSVPHPGPALELLCFQLRAAAELHRDLLTGILEGLAGRRGLPLPAAWSSAYAKLQKSRDDAVLDAATRLALVFDDPAALAALRKQAADLNIVANARTRAINALVSSHPDDLPPSSSN